MTDVLERLAQRLRAEGGLLADVLVESRESHGLADDARHGAVAAAGPRAAADPARYELLVEAIREGYLLHYAEGRVLASSDPDLALLAGDRLYALGIAELTQLGDVEAIRELADVISIGAQARANGEDDLAEAVWEAGAAAVGWGTSEAHATAKTAARQAEPAAADALRAAARDLAPAE